MRLIAMVKKDINYIMVDVIWLERLSGVLLPVPRGHAFHVDPEYSGTQII